MQKSPWWWARQTFNMPALPGETGAGTAMTNVVLAIAYANHVGGTVLVGLALRCAAGVTGLFEIN